MSREFTSVTFVICLLTVSFICSFQVAAVPLLIHPIVGAHLVIHLIVRDHTLLISGEIDHILPTIGVIVVVHARGPTLHTTVDHQSVAVARAMIILLMSDTTEEGIKVVLKAIHQGEGAILVVTRLGQGGAQGEVTLGVFHLGRGEAQGEVILGVIHLGQGEAPGEVTLGVAHLGQRKASGGATPAAAHQD